METAVCSIAKKKFVNRGFLNGPLCPVYGFGALICILVLQNRTGNIALLFFAGMALTSALEYITSVILEKLFNAKWWDYSERRFNIHGRVCLKNAVAFGVLSVVLIKLIHPFTAGITAGLSHDVLLITAAAAFAAVMTDLAFTVSHLIGLNGRLKEFQLAFDAFGRRYKKRADELRASFLASFEQSEMYTERMKRRFEAVRAQSRRHLKAYPKLKHIKYADAWRRFKTKIAETKKETKRTKENK